MGLAYSFRGLDDYPYDREHGGRYGEYGAGEVVETYVLIYRHSRDFGNLKAHPSGTLPPTRLDILIIFVFCFDLFFVSSVGLVLVLF